MLIRKENGGDDSQFSEDQPITVAPARFARIGRVQIQLRRRHLKTTDEAAKRLNPYSS
jgi:hypothetical protein